MARQYDVLEKIYQALTQVARKKGQFTTTKMREELGFVVGSKEAQAMHNLIVTLKKAEIVKPTAAGRSRNQFLYVDPGRRTELEARYERARRLSGSGASTTSPTIGTNPPAAPKIVLELRQRLDDLESQFEDLRPLATLADELALVPGKLDLLASDVEKLVEMWS